MTYNRTGEHGNTVPNRNDRVFEKSSYWYYTTREGLDIGPFDSHTDAEEGASEFISFIQGAEPDLIQTLEQYGNNAA